MDRRVRALGGLLIVFAGLGGIPLLCQNLCQRQMRIRQIGFQAYRYSIVVDRLAGTASGSEQVGQITLRLSAIGSEFYSLAQFDQRAIVGLGQQQKESVAMVGINVGGVAGDSL